MINKQYITYTHVDSEIDSIGSLISETNSIVRNISVKNLLQYKGDTSLSNVDRVYAKYNAQEKRENKTTYEQNLRGLFTTSLSLLKLGTVLLLPKENLYIEIVAINGQNQVPSETDFDKFISEQHKTLLSDNKYRIADVMKNVGSNQSVIQEHNHCTVWLWSRALSESNHPTYSDSLINITPFVKNLNTNVDANGGNFSMQLAPVLGKFLQDTWHLDSRRINNYYEQQINNNYVAYIDSHNSDNSRNHAWLDRVVTANDLVFIRFEALEMEKEDRSENHTFTINKSNIAGKTYDMIGLVDKVGSSFVSESNMYDMSISGRDLMKLLIDDGCYTNSIQFANIYLNRDADFSAGIIKRLEANGQFILNSAYAYRSIRYSIQFIINYLSNLSIVPDDLFTSYALPEDRRSYEYEFKEEETSVVGKAGDVSFDTRERCYEIIANQRTSVGMSTETLEVTAAFLAALSFVKQAKAQNAFRESGIRVIGYDSFIFNGSSIPSIDDREEKPLIEQGLTLFGGTQFRSDATVNASGDVSIAYVPSELLSLIFQYLQYDEVATVLDPQKQLMSGIWQIVKIFIDDSVANLRLHDVSISNPDSSLLEQMYKICQSPFVEFMGDTYGDQYYFTARKPPFTREALEEWIVNDYVIDIEPSSIRQDSLSWDNDNIYTWYEIRPQSLFQEGSQIVAFPQLADIWGSKRYSVVDNYLPYGLVHGDSSTENRNFYIQQVASDLAFAIESTVYQPFTRKGTIVLNGDRTIKRGTWIRYKITNEIFYVDSVSQTYSVNMRSIQRTTTLQVSRGMVEEYVRGSFGLVNGVTVGMSYFDICNVDLIKESITAQLTNVTSLTESEGASVDDVKRLVRKNFGINEDVLKFFLSRRFATNE